MRGFFCWSLRLLMFWTAQFFKKQKAPSFEGAFVPFKVELSNLFIEDLKKLSYAFKLLTK